MLLLVGFAVMCIVHVEGSCGTEGACSGCDLYISGEIIITRDILFTPLHTQP